MLYSVLIYESEPYIESLSEEEDRRIVEGHEAFQDEARRRGQLGPVARLMSTATAVTLRPRRGGPAEVLDGPYTETKEHLVGFYVIEAESLEAAIELVRGLPLDTGCFEIRPVQWFHPGVRRISSEKRPGAPA